MDWRYDSKASFIASTSGGSPLPPRLAAASPGLPDAAIAIQVAPTRSAAPRALIDRRYKIPVRSDVPVLLVAGTLDSLTPPSWAREVAETLPNSHLVEVEVYSHSPSFAGECTAMMALGFFADPTTAPEESCLADLQLRFALPEQDS